jgi:putative ABC transport system substrate-binding protein
VLRLILMLGLVAAPFAVEAQPVKKIPRVGVIGDQSPSEPRIEAFRQGLRELGYTEGKNIIVEYRYAHGVVERFADLTAELLRLQVDILVVGGPLAAQVAKAQTRTVAIVFTSVTDPLGAGLVTSLARPGANLTGLTTLLGGEMSAKHLQLLKQTVPQVSRVTVLCNPTSPTTRLVVERVQEAARALAVELQVLEVRQANELVSAFAEMKAWRAGAVLVLSDPMFGNALVQLSTLAARDRLPAIYTRREFALAGGLLAYGPSFSDIFRRAATYVDKIIKGAKPADLPVEQPAKFDMVVNLKTAKALGLTIPPSVLSQATEVIE